MGPLLPSFKTACKGYHLVAVYAPINHIMNTVFFVLLMLICACAHGQEFRNQRTALITTNLGINGVVGGIGALANKKKEEKVFRTFTKGFAQGCLGGAFNVFGKQLTYQIKSENNLGYAWAARLTSSVGSSITQNAASNRNFWERWHFNLAFVRFDYHVPDKKFQARLFPSSLYGAYVVGRQARFNLKSSLQTGIMVYTSDNLISHLGLEARGHAIISSIGIQNGISGQDYYDLMAHETMHIIQADNMVWLNPFFNKTDAKWKTQSGFYRKASNYFYLDLNGLTILGIYLTQIKQPWECRWLEREAEHFSQRVIIPSCN